MRKGNAGHEEFAVGIGFHVAGRRACFDVVTCDGGRGGVTEQQKEHDYYCYYLAVAVVGMKRQGEGVSAVGHRSRNKTRKEAV